MKKLKIGIDIGGVISKYPQIFTPIINALSKDGHLIYIITDMHSYEDIYDMLDKNNIPYNDDNFTVISSDFNKYGEACKSILGKNLELDLMIDDFPAYLQETAKCNLLVLPNIKEPYYHDDWKTNGKEGDFGRRKKNEYV